MLFSLIIPVYNRPDEVEELLSSLVRQAYKGPFEVVIIEDGSSITCRDVVSRFRDRLQVAYCFKENSGPGDSRNYGMLKAQGDYYIILDSDCIIPENYLSNVAHNLSVKYADCFGGPDAAHGSFSKIQKAINFSMTSVLTTGGIRGNSETVGKFQPRSFNMGLSAEAFRASGGFGNIHPGEDPDLSIRLWKLGFETTLFRDCYVYHKRRIDWGKFYTQVRKFGKVRPILDAWHPEYKKATFLFPSLFVIGFAVSFALLFAAICLPFILFLVYFLIVFVLSSVANRNLLIGGLSVVAVAIQFYGYGTGYLLSFINVSILRRQPEKVFPKLFFRKA